MADTRTDIKIEDNPNTAQDKKEEDAQIPKYESRINFPAGEAGDEDKKRIVKEILEELDAIDKEWSAAKVLEKLEALENQYKGECEQNKEQIFNLDSGLTSDKVDKTVTRICDAFLKSEPVFAITPRPDMDRNNGQEICDKQSDFLDSEIDNNIPLARPFKIVAHNATLKGCSIIKIDHRIRREQKQREEVYDGANTQIQIVQNPKTGQPEPVVRNLGLEEFVRNYPDSLDKYFGYVKQLQEGKKVNIVVSYKETTINCPWPEPVLLEDFRVRLKTEGYDGLKTCKVTGEKQSYTWWEMKALEEKDEFFDIDELMYDNDEKKEKGEKRENYLTKEFEIWECTAYVKLKEKDEEDTKCVFWIDRDKKIMIGGKLYPFYAVPSRYIPFYIQIVNKGFLQPGLGEKMTQDHLAINAFINMLLQAQWMRNMITPITEEGSKVDTQFIEKRWVHGMPINCNPKEIDFLQKYMQNIDMGGSLAIMQFVLQRSDAKTGINTGMSGKESPLDPNAPGNKTIALLGEADKNIAQYIWTMLPSFNEIGYALLNIYYQMSKEGRKYSISKDKIKPGQDLFGMITRDEMVARTNIQAQAYTFAFDKMNEKREDLALYQVARGEKLVADNPESVYYLLKEMISGWSPKWRNRIEKILPPLAQVQQKMAQVIIGAVQMFVADAVKTSQITGVEPQFNPEKLLTTVTQALSEVATQPPPEVLKERAKNAKEQGIGV
jgi:hypothetical protein